MSEYIRANGRAQSLTGRLLRRRRRDRGTTAATGGVAGDRSAARFEALEPRLLLSTGQATLTSTAAAWASESNPDTNYGTQATVVIGSNAASKGENAYVAFDLSALPAGAEVTAATLRLDCTAVTGGAQGVQVYVVADSCPWTEGTLTWTNQPDSVLGIGGTWVVVTNVPAAGWITWDVTGAVQQWRSGEWDNNGFMMIGQYSGASGQRTFASDDAATAGNRPQLVVDYAINTPTITSLKLNNGSTGTASRTVTLDADYDHTPAEYQASQFADFHDATWQALPASGSPNFTLSAGNGQHTVYLKVRNSAGECPAAASASINLQESIPDLYISGISVASDRPPAGGTVSVTVRVSNAGLSASTASTTTIYWSADATIDSSDQALLAKPTPAIDPSNGYYEFTADVPIPAVVQAGQTYYLGAVADTAATSGEQDHTNDASSALAVQPLGVWIDTANIWTSDDRPRGGEWVTVTVPVRNDGGATDAVVSLSLYDPTFAWPVQTPTDSRLVYDSTAAGADRTLHFTAAGTLNATFQVQVPAGRADGQYVMLAEASDQPRTVSGAFVFDTTGPDESAADLTAAAYVGGFTADAGGYRLFDHWGGAWQDAEKDAPPSPGDQMCWAAASSNILAWTGWNAASGLTTADAIFGYFQAHWSDLGGDPSCAWQYWFDGTNPQQGTANFSQITTTPPGGGFYPALNVDSYLLQQTYGVAHPLSKVMADAYTDLTLGAGVSISVDYDGSHGHSITLWGVDTYSGSGTASDPTDPAHYTGVWLTDSDDDKTQPDGATARDRLRYFSLTWSAGDGHYTLDNYSTLHTYYIDGAIGLKSAANQAPTVAAFGKSLDKGTTLSFVAANFTAAFTDPDVGDSLQTVKITSLPGHGSLKLSGQAVATGQEIPVSQLAGLVYTPTPTFAGSDSFGWNGSDGHAYAGTAAAVNLTVNDTAPDNTGPTVTIAAVTPSPRDTTVASIGIVFSEPVTGLALEDLSLSRDAADVPLGAATLTSSDGGRTWTLGGLAALTGTGGAYTLTLTAAGSAIADGDGNPLAAGDDTTWAANFAPVLDAGASLWLTGGTEDSGPTPGTPVSAILASAGADPITDGDAGALEGIAVVGADNTHGSWQYSTDGTTWLNFGSPSAGAARLLRATDSVRFVPAAQFGGTVGAGLTFHAWDQTTGTAGQTAGLSAAGAVGGLTAFSDAVAAAGVVVDAVNDRPTAGGGSAITEPDTPVDMVLAATDVETAYANLTFNVPARAGHGTLTEATHGTYRYQPDPGYAGADSFQFTVTDDGDPAGSHAGGGDLTSDPATVTIQMGWEQALDSKGVATYRDANNELVKVALTGGGTGKLLFARQPVLGDGLDVGLIVLDGTSSKSALTITTTGVGSATTVGGIQVSGGGSFGTITGKTTSLNGPITVPGLLGAVALDDALTGSSIDADASLLAPGTTQLALTFDYVTDTSVNTHREPIKAIAVTEWANTLGSGLEQIAAPWIAAITTVGRKANPKATPPVAAGDFSANLALSGAVAPLRTPTLGTVRIAGAVAGTTWNVTGDAGAITIAGTADGWTLQGGGAAGAGLRTVKTLTLADVHNVTILADGALGAVKALNWDRGAITADSLTSLAVTGRKAAGIITALPGDFSNANLTLRADAAPAAGKATITALGSASIAGGLANSTWAIDMDAGAISAAGAVSGWTLAGADSDADGAAPGLLSVKSLTLGNVTDANVTIKTALLPVTSALHVVSHVTAGGVLGAVKALGWDTGTIEADSLASLTITGRKLTPTAGAVVGNFGANVTLHGANLAARKPAAGAVSIAADLDTSQWLVTGSMTTLAVTGTAKDSTIRATGSIASITLGAGNGSKFLAGVTSAQLDPAAVTSADLEPTGLATIGSITVKGWSTAGTPPAFLTASSFLAPCLGTVSLLNCEPGTWDLYALPGPTVARIKTVTLTDTRSPKDPAYNWTWTAAKNLPASAGGAANEII